MPGVVLRSFIISLHTISGTSQQLSADIFYDLLEVVAVIKSQE
jgi:hypothetical protein